MENVLFREDLFKEKPDGLVLVGNKCPRCGKTNFPKAEFCTQCLTENLEEVELSKRGILYSYTITRVPVGRFQAPHPIGLILLPEKVRILAPLIMGKEEFQVGDEVEMVIDTLWQEEGKNVIGYKFKVIGKNLQGNEVK